MEVSPASVIILYHGGCKDGFMAAAIGKKRFGEGMVFYIPLSPNEATLVASIDTLPYPPDTEIYCYDVSFTKKTLDLIIKKYPDIKIFDHHKTTLEAIRMGEYSHNVHCDIEHSGAVLAWNHLFPGEDVPLAVRYIEDRDLFVNKMAYTEEINTWLWVCYPCELVEIDRWVALLDGESWADVAILQGALILKTHKQLMADIIKTATYHVIGGHKVACVETNLFRTDIGALIYNSDAVDYVMIWRTDLSTQKVFVSLRSKTVDVEAIARRFGGGGHRLAAGFEIDIPSFFEFVSGENQEGLIWGALRGAWKYVRTLF
jgi:oligoribonuclease NrnB/cAMP/cGMP phosphodiesterase (DHH superfamily)